MNLRNKLNPHLLYAGNLPGGVLLKGKFTYNLFCDLALSVWQETAVVASTNHQPLIYSHALLHHRTPKLQPQFLLQCTCMHDKMYDLSC